MGTSARRLAVWLFVLALVWNGAAHAGWAKERRSIVKEAWVWSEAGELRIQGALANPAEEGALVFRQAGQEAVYPVEHGSRFSVAVMPRTSDEPLTVEWAEDRQTEPAALWQITVPDSVRLAAEGLQLREVPWERKAAQKEARLPLPDGNAGADGAKVEEADVKPAGDQEMDTEAKRERDRVSLSSGGSSQREVQRWADDFYDAFPAGKKPKEAALRSRQALFELEPNDTFGKADWLFDAKDGYGKIGKDGDVDTWKIKASSSGTMNVALRDIPPGQDYNLYVYSEENRELGSSEKDGRADETVEGIAMEKNSWYYIVVKGRNGSYHKDFYYRLRADFLPDRGNAKADEYEPNNSAAEAYALATDFDATLQANLHGLDDVDYYKFGITLSSTVRLDLQELPAGMDLDLYLLDQAGKVLSKSEKPKNANEQIVFQANPGTYTIKVVASKRSGFAPNTYKLVVKSSPIPVILIPGIGGSRLEAEEDGEISEIWLGLGDSLIGINDPRHRRLLSLEPMRPGSVDVRPRNQGVRIFPERADEGFSAIEYLSYSPIDPVRDKTEQYYSMVKELEKLGYKKFRTLFAMPYDWRYSNAQNAEALKQKIDLALQRSGASQVQLVAHSMGGLLVRETLLSNVSYQGKVHRIIYMGTPFLGAPRAYQAIRYGYDFSIPWMDEETGKIISEYAPAVYELLPSRKYFEKVPFLRKDRNEPYSYDEFINDPAIRLSYSPLVKQAGKLHDKWDNKLINVPQYSIIGSGEPTLLGYFFDAYHQTWAPYYDRGMGDGTVPYLSASYGQKDIRKKYYAKGEHAKLPTIPQVIRQVSQLLQGNEETQPGLRKSADRSQPYLTYILSRSDGSFPEVRISKSGKSQILAKGQKEAWDDLSIEYHGNLAVLHVKDGEELTFEDVAPRSGNDAVLYIQRFSSEDSEEEQETGKWYRIGQRGSLEAVNANE
ncbi:pre-peptidase C-terminal domain-containing protein [Brevibacillus sp. GCM10020057]|uniref:lipase/acyltransferase domain-containing protein n=1 Tax=Brevibacillus sp. GCM10020057 TaxID=3317327 RepID=UPI00362E0985